MCGRRSAGNLPATPQAMPTRYAAGDAKRFFVFVGRARVGAAPFSGRGGAASRASRSARSRAVFSMIARRSAWYSAIACSPSRSRSCFFLNSASARSWADENACSVNGARRHLFPRYRLRADSRHLCGAASVLRVGRMTSHAMTMIGAAMTLPAANTVENESPNRPCSGPIPNAANPYPS